ncbi:MAG: nitroreductase family protein, partial [Planctomycetota bacterium]
RLARLHEGRSQRAIEDLTLAAGYYASGGRLLSLLKGAVACVRLPRKLARLLSFRRRVASPLVPAPFPERAEEWAVKSAMLAAQSYMFAAASHGLATAPMEGFDSNRLRLYLDVPPRYSIPLVVATGYPCPDDQNRPLSPRFPPEDLFFRDSFGVPFSFPSSSEAKEEPR